MTVRYQIASDVVRDGLGIELLDGANAVVAEVFRSDALKTLTVTCFKEDIAFSEFESFMATARQELGAFEDGTPLPPPLK